MPEESDDTGTSNWGRAIVLAALISGGSSSASLLTADTSDRFKRAEFDTEIAERDTTITALRDTLGGHLQHSATYTQIIKELQKEVAELKAEVHDHQRGGMHITP